jgi:hypothetical protein
MSNDLAALSASPRSVTLGGEAYQVSPFTMRDLGTLGAYLKDVVPHPVAAVRMSIAGMDESDKALVIQEAFAEARTHWPPRFESDQGQEILVYSREGRAKLTHVILSKHQPDLTIDQAMVIADAMLGGEFLAMMSLASGKEPKVPNSGTATTTQNA